MPINCHIMSYDDIIMPHPDIKMSFLDKKTPQSDVILPYHDITMLYSHINMPDRDIIIPYTFIIRQYCA